MKPAAAAVVVAMLMPLVAGHGTLMKPIQRSSMWKDPRFPHAPPNFNDIQLYCGGNHGGAGNPQTCGVCGDDVRGDRPNEAGGKYANGVIVEKYTQGQVIDVEVEITANHKGYFLFKLCPVNDPHKRATEECLNQHVLVPVTPSPVKPTTNIRERYYVDYDKGTKHLQVKLPDDVTCTQCVLQWTYMAANTWGCEKRNGQNHCCTGCGAQENFVNCADISIAPAGGAHAHTHAPAATHAPATKGPTSAPILGHGQAMSHGPSGCVPVAALSGKPGVAEWCQKCPRDSCPTNVCRCP